jgi:DNA-directed RNA polymerase subunit alpha
MSPKWKELEMPEKIVANEKTVTGTYSEFIISPVESGYGVTLGNSLRRILLSSLRGAAVTSVKISKVLHEFVGVPGIKEDASDIILNLKQLIVKLHTDEPKVLYLSVNGAQQREVLAKDIKKDSGVEILNQNLHIATLSDSKSRLEMEIEISPGKGYILAEALKKEEQVIGEIPIDASFSPVKRVNFRMGSSRVGQRTDFDKLFLEIWTNGSVSPKDALSDAASILRRYLKPFVIEEEEEEEEEVEEEQPDEEELKMKKYLNTNVNELELSVRAANCVERASIKIVGELVSKTEAEMLKYKNFGKKSLEEIKEVLKEMGLFFNMEFDKKILDIPDKNDKKKDKKK